MKDSRLVLEMIAMKRCHDSIVYYISMIGSTHIILCVTANTHS